MGIEGKVKGRIFLLEDVGVVQRTVYSALEMGGYSVDIHDGEIFMTYEMINKYDFSKGVQSKPSEAIFLNDYKAAILDIDVKGDSRGGITTLKAIRRDERTKDMPIIITTRIGERDLVEQIKKLGGVVKYYLKGQKDFSPIGILQTVDDILGF
jgi:CheY-like chemotaxis protein